MSTKLPPIWSITPHTSAKHQLLTRYLGAWFPILSRWRGRIVFLDGFAGPGIYKGGEKGSPCLALDVLLDHGYLDNMKHCEFVFIFNEQNDVRFASLEKQVEAIRAPLGDWPDNVTVHVKNQNFLDLADDILAGLEGAKLAPTFAFIDPFGYKDTPIAKISELLAYDKCELFIYFDANSVSRFATAKNPPASMTAMFGTDRHRDAPASGPARAQFLHDLYQFQLETVCNFPYVRSFEMVNDRGHTGNYLFYCTRSLTGLKRMKEAMWSVDPGGDYRFSDRNVGQEVILSPNADTRILMDTLATYFAGKTVSPQEVEDFIVGSTNFAAGHMKRQTLKPMQQDGRISVFGQKIPGTFPDRVRITFPLV